MAELIPPAFWAQGGLEWLSELIPPAFWAQGGLEWLSELIPPAFWAQGGSEWPAMLGTGSYDEKCLLPTNRNPIWVVTSYVTVTSI